jgi:antitoxin component of MazEF toxin-antitoxin module
MAQEMPKKYPRRLTKNGNSMAFNIPPELVKDSKPGDLFYMYEDENGKIVIEKGEPEKKQRKYKFEDLMSKVTKENANKFDWSKSMGREIW